VGVGHGCADSELALQRQADHHHHHNYADLPAAAGGLSGPERAAREDTLGDRIGDRMRSRLAEMCVRIEMTGEDFRQTVKRARFG